LAEESATPPEGIFQNDWDRVITYQKQARDEVEVSDLMRLGPKVGDSQVVASVDGIRVRRPQKRRFHELRTAKVVRTKGYRYVSGANASFLGYLLLLIRLCLPEGGFLTVLPPLYAGGIGLESSIWNAFITLSMQNSYWIGIILLRRNARSFAA